MPPRWFTEIRAVSCTAQAVLAPYEANRTESKACRVATAATPGCAHLLHEHVDMQLGRIEDIAVWLAHPLQGPLHCPAVNVDPAGSSRGQELPGTQMAQSRPMLGLSHGQLASPPTHLLIDSIHQGRDLGLPAKAQLLTSLPEGEVFR